MTDQELDTETTLLKEYIVYYADMLAWNAMVCIKEKRYDGPHFIFHGGWLGAITCSYAEIGLMYRKTFSSWRKRYVMMRIYKGFDELGVYIVPEASEREDRIPHLAKHKEYTHYRLDSHAIVFKGCDEYNEYDKFISTTGVPIQELNIKINGKEKN